MSNPQGINQYTKGGRHVGQKAQNRAAKYDAPSRPKAKAAKTVKKMSPTARALYYAKMGM
jgi:hypothetical protein